MIAYTNNIQKIKINDKDKEEFNFDRTLKEMVIFNKSGLRGPDYRILSALMSSLLICFQFLLNFNYFGYCIKSNRNQSEKQLCSCWSDCNGCISVNLLEQVDLFQNTFG